MSDAFASFNCVPLSLALIACLRVRYHDCPWLQGTSKHPLLTDSIMTDMSVTLLPDKLLGGMANVTLILLTSTQLLAAQRADVQADPFTYLVAECMLATGQVTSMGFFQTSCMVQQNRQTEDRQTDRSTDRPTDRQTDASTDLIRPKFG